MLSCRQGVQPRAECRARTSATATPGCSFVLPCRLRPLNIGNGVLRLLPQPQQPAEPCLAPSPCRDVLAHSASSAGAAAPLPGAGPNKSGSPGWLPWLVLGLAGLAAGAYLLSEPGQVFREVVVNGPLGKSGFLAAFSLIFLSEIGDKTFFIAALLAMKIGKWMSFIGSVSALAVMTVISVGIGAVFSRVPDALRSSIPIGELAGVALLVFFGVKALRDGLSRSEDGASASDDELADAESAVQSVEGGARPSPLAVFLEVATLIFLAEWGDRSMLATIALGAAQNPVGVAVGAIAGHSIATGIAVLGGAIASKYISEKTVNVVSGLLFLLFAGATAFSML